MAKTRKVSVYGRYGSDGEFCGHIHRDIPCQPYTQVMEKCIARLEKKYGSTFVSILESYKTNFEFCNNQVVLNNGYENLHFSVKDNSFQYSVKTDGSQDKVF